MRRKLLLPLMLISLLISACDPAGEELPAPETAERPSASSQSNLSAVDEEEETAPVAAEQETAVVVEEATAEPIAPDDGSSFTAHDCLFAIPPNYELTCGTLFVPENRTLDDSPTIELAVAILHAVEDEGRAPIVYLAGGPGGSAIDDFLADPEGWDYPFTQGRDLILVDQRGTGYSWPTLDCPELNEEYEFEEEDPERLCHERLLAEGIDLTAYNTAENAADIAALRRALNIDSWDLLGISYGTRLALAIMRDHPQGVRSAVLDSVFPPNADTPGVEALSPLWSLDTLYADCSRDAYCSENYPDLEDVFLETVAALNEQPRDDTYGDDVAFAVSNALNDTELIPLLPYVIYEVANGNMAALDEIATEQVGSRRYQEEPDRSDSEGMYNAVICHDEYVFGSYETAEAAMLAESPPELEAVFLQPVYDHFRVCGYWAAGAAGALENEAVFSEIPTLILAGQYDLATPPWWADLAAETLPNSFVYEFPGAGHSLLSSDYCAIEITDQFLNAPHEEPDASCIDSIEWPYFE